MLRLNADANEAQIEDMARTCSLHDLCTAEARTRDMLFQCLDSGIVERKFYLTGKLEGCDVREAVQLYDEFGPCAEDKAKRGSLQDRTLEVEAIEAARIAKMKAEAKAKAAAEAVIEMPAPKAPEGSLLDVPEKAEGNDPNQEPEATTPKGE